MDIWTMDMCSPLVRHPLPLVCTVYERNLKKMEDVEKALLLKKEGAIGARERER